MRAQNLMEKGMVTALQNIHERIEALEEAVFPAKEPTVWDSTIQ